MVFKDLEIAPKFKMLDGTYNERFIKSIWHDAYENPAAMILYYNILYSMSPTERKNGHCIRKIDRWEAYRIYDTIEDIRKYIAISFGKDDGDNVEVMFSFPYETPAAIRFANNK